MTLPPGLTIVPPSGSEARWLLFSWAWQGYRSSSPVERILPHGHVEIVWDVAGPMTFWDGREQRRFAGPVVVGPRAHPYWVDTHRSQHLVGLMLRPATSRAWFDCAAEDLAGGFFSLAAFPAARAIHSALTDPTDDAMRFRSVARTLGSLRARGSAREAARLIATWEHDLDRSVASIRDELGISHPTFVRRIREALGMRPGRYRQLVRIRRILPRLTTDSGGLARVAAEGGFADQAHLSRTFREITGLTPSRYQPLLSGHYFNVADPDVSFRSRR